MIRWLLPLAPCLLWACIEDIPAIPEGCGPTACGQAPDVSQVRCEDNAGPVVRCEPQDDGACGWTIEPCDPPPEDLVECTPELCGPQPDGAACPDGEAPRATCENAGVSCAWQIDCEPAGCCAGDVPAGAPCEPGFEGTLECIDCEWVLGCEPVDCARPGACGPMPINDSCGMHESPFTECRETREGCEWTIGCEPLCSEDACGEQPIPNCADYTADCAPAAQGCTWQIECVDRCALPFDPGPCDGLAEVWWFNPESYTCEQQTYGGCEGNANRFASEEECRDACAPVPGK